MKNKIIILGLLLAGSFMFGQTELGKVKIHLNNRFTNQPVTYAHFTLTLNDDVKSIHTTDSLGNFSSDALKKGNYKMEINCTNYQSTYRTNTVSENKTTEVVFNLWPTTFYRVPEKSQKLVESK